MHSNAMQINRAVCCLYALTGQYDAPGGNVLIATPPSHPVEGPHLLPREKAAIRLGLKDHPLGPPNDPGHVQAGNVYEAILTGRPYKIRAMVCFGSDPLIKPRRCATREGGLGGSRILRSYGSVRQSSRGLRRSAVTRCDRLGIRSTQDKFSWAVEGRAPLRRHVGRRCAKRWCRPQAGARSDLAVIFDLASRLGLGEHFFGGDTEKAWRHQLEPSGLTLEELRAHPLGVSAQVTTHHRKYESIDPQTATPTRLCDAISKAGALFNAICRCRVMIPCRATTSRRRVHCVGRGRALPLILTLFRMVQFVNEQHRNIPRLRNEAREPVIEIHPETAAGLGISDGEWVNVETVAGKIRLKAKYNNSLHPKVVCAHYGWWQACGELGLPAYDPFSPEGANVNLAIANKHIDRISASDAASVKRVSNLETNVADIGSAISEETEPAVMSDCGPSRHFGALRNLVAIGA